MQRLDHLVHGTQASDVDWTRPSNIFWPDEVPRRSIDLVETDDVTKYSWVDYEIHGSPFALNSHVVVKEVNVEVVCLSNLLVLHLESVKKICNNF